VVVIIKRDGHTPFPPLDRGGIKKKKIPAFSGMTNSKLI
jgi:hypothetical protein